MWRHHDEQSTRAWQNKECCSWGCTESKGGYYGIYCAACGWWSCQSPSRDSHKNKCKAKKVALWHYCWICGSRRFHRSMIHIPWMLFYNLFYIMYLAKKWHGPTTGIMNHRKPSCVFTLCSVTIEQNEDLPPPYMIHNCSLTIVQWTVLHTNEYHWSPSFWFRIHTLVQLPGQRYAWHFHAEHGIAKGFRSR